ncbi:hypothetical protein R1flu_000650 [Riccia fluitans]|uniref:YDG domain-containing protein n=1 Tax=Riccia fluitans TaxID=41844 RepID=A0ABD1Y115_9MARC
MSSSNARAESPENSDEFAARAAIKQVLAEFRQMKKEVVPLAPNSTGTALKVVKAMREKNPQLVMNKNHIGRIAGIKVGDTFDSRGEASVIGLHGPVINGINTVKPESVPSCDVIANSVAFSIGNTYPDNSYDESAGILVFSGEGRNHPDANMSQSKKKPGTDKMKIRPQGNEDQKETARNKALINSFLENIPIRVIRGDPSRMAHDEEKYTYEGLFEIEKYEQKKGLHNNLVYTFHMKKKEDQR